MSIITPRLAPVLFLLMWSSGAIFVKLGLMDASVWSFLAVRAVGAVLVLVPILALGVAHEFRAAFRLPGRTILWVLAIGLLLQVGYQCSYFLAIAYGVSPSLLTIILCAQPLLMPWVAGEQVPVVGKTLLLIAFLGLLMTIAGAGEIKPGSVGGVAFGLMALASIAVGSGLQKRLGIGIVPTILWQYLGAAAVFVGIVVVTGWRASLTLGFLGSAAWMILIVSVGANTLLLYLLSRHDAAQVGSLFYLVPIITMIADHYAYGEVISVASMVGTLTVIASALAFVHARRLQVMLQR